MSWWLVWIIVFLVVIFGVSIISSRKIETSDDYVMANFSLGFFPIAGTVIATVAGSAALIGAAGKGYEIGTSYIITAISQVIFTIVFVLIIGPIIRKLKLYTIPDLFVRRFGKAAALIPALIIGLLYMVPTFSMQLVGMSTILTSIIDISTVWSIVLAFLVSVTFTLMGGMFSVAWTDAVQTVVILAGVVLMFIFGLNHIGGVEVFREESPEHLLNFLSIGKMELLNWFLVFGPFYMVWQTTWQRITAAKSTKTATWSVTIGFIIAGVIQVLAVLIGIMAIQTMGTSSAPDDVYTNFMVDLFPPAIGGLFMVSLLAALLTGATSFLLSGAINVSKDIYQEWINPDAEDAKILKVSRFSVLGMAIIGLLIALFITDIITIYDFALSFTAVTLTAPVIAIFFWKRATKTGAIVSMVGSIIIAAIWKLADKPFGIHEIAPGLAVSIILLIVVSLMTNHSAKEEVVSYYFKTKGENDPGEMLNENAEKTYL